MASIIFHIDVNSAYLSWTAVEQLKNGSTVDLREIPAIIGRGPEVPPWGRARQIHCGKTVCIRTGEPVANAFRKCPNLVTAPPDHRMYREKSRLLMEYLRTFTKEIEQVSVDECYMDFTSIADRWNSPIDGALEIKDGIREKFGFTVNIGISTNKLLAKMASDFEKPDRIHTLFPEEIREKMWPLPIGELYNGGKVQRGSAQEAGDQYHRGSGAGGSPAHHAPSEKSREDALEIRQRDRNRRRPGGARAGKGNRKFHHSVGGYAATYEEACPVFRELADSVGRRLKKAGQKAGMVSMEIKYYDFRSVSHQTQLERPSSDPDILYQTACSLFREIWSGEPVRLLGIRTSKLVDETEPEQLTIFDIELPKEPDEKHRKLKKALDELNSRYGEGAVVKASLMKKGGKDLGRRGRAGRNRAEDPGMEERGGRR